jgi:hypothetical protein
MTSNVASYRVEQEVINFSKKATTTRSACDAFAKELIGCNMALVDVQEVCSYTVYAGSDQEFVVQFRLRSLALNLETIALAQKIHGDLVPPGLFQGPDWGGGC